MIPHVSLLPEGTDGDANRNTRESRHLALGLFIVAMGLGLIMHLKSGAPGPSRAFLSAPAVEVAILQNAISVAPSQRVIYTVPRPHGAVDPVSLPQASDAHGSTTDIAASLQPPSMEQPWLSVCLRIATLPLAAPPFPFSSLQQFGGLLD